MDFKASCSFGKCDLAFFYYFLVDRFRYELPVTSAFVMVPRSVQFQVHREHLLKFGFVIEEFCKFGVDIFALYYNSGYSKLKCAAQLILVLIEIVWYQYRRRIQYFQSRP